ncbi:MAG: DUF167 domain-containing protein [Gemmatimonadota bacterium]|nr:DUF167 domain-containing protein [Gemmatimonadota bacterium]
MANKALIEFLSDALGISRCNVCIVSGETARTKVVEVSEVGLEVVQRLATEGVTS